MTAVLSNQQLKSASRTSMASLDESRLIDVDRLADVRTVYCLLSAAVEAVIRFTMRFRAHLPGTARVLSIMVALLLLATGACSMARAQATIHVPQDQPTIQAGIDAAHDGDTVVVSPGTYKVNLDFKGKAITLTTGATSYTAPVVAATTLRPADVTLAIVAFKSREGLGSVLNGFTLTDGTIVPGPFSPIFFDDDFTYEVSVYGSSNVFNELDASPTITNNRFVQGYRGVELAGGEIAGNYFTGFVWGMITSGGHVHDNLFEDNPNGGIGIFGGLFERNVIRNNSVVASEDWAGLNNALIYISGGVFLQNVVYGNYNQFILDLFTYGYGPPSVIVAENTFADNTVSLDAAPSFPDNCMGPGCAPLPPAQIVFESEGSPHGGNGLLVVNNIFSTSSPGPAIFCPYLPDEFHPPAADTLQFDHNLFNASTGPIFDPSCRQQIMASGNAMDDPMFVNPAAGDYHLSEGSPAIDTGNNSLLAESFSIAASIASDLDGHPRPVDATGLGYPVLDRGAYEFAGAADAQPSRLLLTPSSYTPFTSQTFTLTAALSSALGPPQGTITLLKDGVKIAAAPARGDGTAVFSFPPPTASGVHEFEADYAGLYPYPPATSLKLVVGFAVSQTQLFLNASPKSVLPGQSTLLTILAIANDGSVPSPITLTDNGAPLTTLTPNPSGQATLNVTLSPGTHTLVATYAGDVTHVGSTASVVVTVIQNDFTITLQPPSITVPAGQQVEVNIVLSSLGSFADTLNLSAGAGPQYVTLSFSPTTASLSPGGTASSVLTINTVVGRQSGRLGHPPSETGIPLVFAALAALPLGLRRRRYPQDALSALLAFVLLSVCVGCSTIGYPLEEAAPGTYAVPITATDPATGMSHTVSLTVIVTA